MPPDPGIPGDSGDSGDEFQTGDSDADAYQKDSFGTPLEGPFSRIFLKGATRDPKGSQ